ncbi:MAG: tetratricopeptide repeat protein [bacterium]
MTRLVSILALIAMVFGLLAFQCTTKEITSARLYINQKNYPKAKEVLQQEIEKNPKSIEGFYLLGFVNGEEGDLESMLTNFDKSLALGKDFAKSIDDSKKYHWANSFNNGVSYFNRANKATDKDSSAIHLNKAIECFNFSIKCQPDSVDNYKNLAFAYLSGGRYEDAIEPLEKLKAKEGSPDSYVRLGEIYQQMALDSKDSVKTEAYYKKAKDVLDEGMVKYPDSGEILVTLANTYLATNRAAEAETLIKKLVEKEPGNATFAYSYGVLLLQKEEYAEALKHLENANSIAPNSETTIYNLASGYINWGIKIRQADEEKGVQSQESKDKFKNAIPYLEQYLQLKPGEAMIWEKLGQVYAQLGETQKSQDAFKKADEFRK